MESLLPIGTICTLKNRTQQIMITGLYAPIYNNALEIYDYRGCIYPDGITLSNLSVSFNQDQIQSIIYAGYMSEAHQKLEKSIHQTNKNLIVESKFESDGLLANIQFDENGTVISDNGYFQKEVLNNAKQVEQPVTVEPKFVFDESGTVVSDGVQTLEEEEKTEYLFDENGTVISDVANQLNENVILNEEPEVIELGEEGPSYQFDANGMIVDFDPMKSNINE